uniref:PD-(D/E)XK nuclease family transposase n=2 Tax=unclassified Candidatus Kentrum TaxID=2643149 RepID=A0A451B6H9_9GAMM|nr:MAG: hypothetical protein BECKUNK1418H_GA0071006_13481 [Candidatus Kentron sp. UNK]
MKIANPIYDVVFKYLMQDNDIARLILSTIIGEEIEALDFLPQETAIALEERSLTVYRLDFSARIRKPDGAARNVIIEIQKAKFAADIMSRITNDRRYLGSQYQNKANTYTVTIAGKKIERAMPIISIYFLGYRLDHTSAPAIKVAREYRDLVSGEEIQEREAFIESLTHDSYVIQIPCLHPDRKTDLEWLLGIFDQRLIISDDKHILEIEEKSYPEKYRAIVRLLHRATTEPKVKETMEAEDEILRELQDLERRIAGKDKAIEEKDKALGEKDKAIEERDKVIEEKDKAMEEKDKALEESRYIIRELRKRIPENPL